MGERNPDPNSKPHVAKWYSEHPERIRPAEHAIATTLEYFQGAHGYINKKDQVEYRFGSSRCKFGDALLLVTQKYIRVQFWLNSKGQRLKSVRLEQRKTVKSAAGTDMFAVDFIVADESSLEALRHFLEINELPNWAPNARGGNASNAKTIDVDFAALSSNEKTEVRREVWMRGPAHDRFKRKLKKLWNGRCSVHDDAANELLVASHIQPWSESDDSERENPLNGLLLSSPLDKLFDRHLISFDDDGKILLSRALTWETKAIFAVDKEMQLRWFHINEQDRSGILTFLAIHREQFQKIMPTPLGKKIR